MARDEVYNEFRFDGRVQRAMRNTRKRTSAPPIGASNEGRPIEVTHLCFTKEQGLLPFLYRFPPKKGYATLYFVGSESVWPEFLKAERPTFYDGSDLPGIPSFHAEGFVRLAAPLSLVQGDSLVTRSTSLYVRGLQGVERCLGLTEDFLSEGRHF